jgi:hypothetical protein
LGAHQLEGAFYYRAGLDNFEAAKYVFERQKQTVGFTAHGVKYKVPYTRKSGDPNTSCGNSIINAMCAKFIFSNVLHIGNHMLVQGDDNLIVVRKLFSNSELREIEFQIRRWYQALGLVVKLKTSTRWSDVEFCSALFWPVEGGFVLGPKPGRRLPKMGFSLKQLNKGQVKGMFLGAVKEAGYIPVLGEYVKFCLKQLKTVKKENYAERGVQYKVRASSAHHRSAETELFFFERYGVDPKYMNSSLMSVLTDMKSFTSMNSWPDLESLLAIDL